jgi:hypothetical protein
MMIEDTRAICETERLQSEVILDHRKELALLRSAHKQEKKQLDQELNATAELFRLQHRVHL